MGKGYSHVKVYRDMPPKWVSFSHKKNLRHGSHFVKTVDMGMSITPWAAHPVKNSLSTPLIQAMMEKCIVGECAKLSAACHMKHQYQVCAL